MDNWDQPTRRKLLEWTLFAMAYGDALGASTEFMSIANAVKFTAQHRTEGYPFEPVGKGWQNLKAGAHTDDTDMALCIARSYIERGDKFDPTDIAERWVGWLNTSPPDVGSTIRAVLGRIRAGEDAFDASAELFKSRPSAAANGALMRNAVTAVIATDLQQVFLCSLLQGAMTHYHPLSVLCCAVHAWLIREFLEGRDPFFKYDDWLEQWHRDWTTWVKASRHPRVREWLDRVAEGESLNSAMATLCEAEFDADKFDPFAMNLGPQQGYVVLALQIAVWATIWSRRAGNKYTFPNHSVTEPVADIFEKRGLHTISWLPLLGNDADTYGAIAAPLIMAAVGKPISAVLTSNLHLHREQWLFEY